MKRLSNNTWVTTLHTHHMRKALDNPPLDYCTALTISDYGDYAELVAHCPHGKVRWNTLDELENCHTPKNLPKQLFIAEYSSFQALCNEMHWDLSKLLEMPISTGFR